MESTPRDSQISSLILNLSLYLVGALRQVAKLLSIPVSSFVKWGNNNNNNKNITYFIVRVCESNQEKHLRVCVLEAKAVVCISFSWGPPQRIRSLVGGVTKFMFFERPQGYSDILPVLKTMSPSV